MVCLKKTKVELELLAEVDMLLIVEKDIRGGMCDDIHRYPEASNNTLKIMIQTKDEMLTTYMEGLCH